MNSNQNLNENLNPSENQKTSGSSKSRSEINKRNYRKGFRYLGRIIRPYKTVLDMDFYELSKNASWENAITREEGWNYKDFYTIDRKHNCGEIDIFTVRGVLMIPASGGMLTWIGGR